DRFIVYKTYSHDNSTIYRLTTWTNVSAWALGWVLPIKITVIFLKVQQPTPAGAYDRLKQAGLTLPAGSRGGLADDADTVVEQWAKPWNSVSSGDITAFCDANMDQIKVGVQETGYLRIVTIVWAPDDKGGDAPPRMRGMAEFIKDRFRVQKDAAKWESVARVPIKWIVGGT
ncbi:hypothetical protein B0T26DRAFT_596103, partial [Lasiosphaeria miniovina]